MTDGVGAHLTVTADLRLDVDGVPARVTGHGDRVEISTDHPVRLLRAARSAASAAGVGERRALTDAVDRLRDAGLTLTVAHRGAALVRAGAGVDSRLGSTLAGTSGVEIVRRPAPIALAGIVALAGAAVLIRRSRPRQGGMRR